MILIIILSRCVELCACPTNCQCSHSTIECYIESCEDELEYRTDTLIIHGELCLNHVMDLEGLNDGTFVILMDDECGKMPHCESMQDSVTVETKSAEPTTTTKKAKLKKKLPTTRAPTSMRTMPQFRLKDRTTRFFPGMMTLMPKATMKTEVDLPTKYK